MIFQVIEQYIDHCCNKRYACYSNLQITGLKKGTEVAIYRPWSGIKVDEGVEMNGMFLSKIEYKEGQRYQVVIRKEGYELLSIRTESRYTTVRMKKDIII